MTSPATRASELRPARANATTGCRAGSCRSPCRLRACTRTRARDTYGRGAARDRPDLPAGGRCSYALCTSRAPAAKVVTEASPPARLLSFMGSMSSTRQPSACASKISELRCGCTSPISIRRTVPQLSPDLAPRRSRLSPRSSRLRLIDVFERGACSITSGVHLYGQTERVLL